MCDACIGSFWKCSNFNYKTNMYHSLMCQCATALYLPSKPTQRPILPHAPLVPTTTLTMPRRLLLGWGSAADGQLGPTEADLLPTPRPFPGLTPHFTPTAFSAGLWNSLIVSHSGAAVHTTASSTTPSAAHSLSLIPGTALPPDSSALPAISAVAAGRDFALLLSAQGGVYTIGDGAYGQLGLGAGVKSLGFPERVTALEGLRIVAVAAAEFHWLALDCGGRVFACGMNSSGQLGFLLLDPVHTPGWVSALWPHPVVAIATGDMHSAVLTAGGVVLAFGSNKSGQLGQASFRVQLKSTSPVPVPMVGGMDVDGDVEMDEAGEEEEQGDGFEDGELKYVDIACGSAHTVALTSEGTLVCWGKGENGQLGTRAAHTLYAPTAVSSPAKFVAVSAGDRHSAAVTEDGVAYVWGDGTLGQIGDGSMTDKFLPVALPPVKLAAYHFTDDSMEWEGAREGNGMRSFHVLQIACGGYHNLALVSDDPHAPVHNAKLHRNRIPKCLVDDMLQAKAGLSRFGSAQMLLRTFVRPHVKPLAKGKIDFEEVNKAYEAFLRLFGDEGRKTLSLAAARIRHEAQIAFGLVKAVKGAQVFQTESHDDDSRRLVTPKSNFLNDDNLFRSSVANFHDCGYLFLIAMLNPIYAERERVPQLAELTGVLLRCEEQGRKAFIEMVSHCPIELLSDRLVRPLQGVLTEELKIYSRVTKNAVNATKALGLCYHGVLRASKRKKLRGLIIPRKEFYNDMVSERVDLAQDYERWSKSQGGALSTVLSDLPPLPNGGQEEELFSFCSYSFLLSEAAKFQILERESQLTMSAESMRSVLSFGSLASPFGMLGAMPALRIPHEHIAHLQFLVLNVRRDNIVSDAFVQIAEMAQNHPRELHKPLKVIFDGEDGVDEGGVRKEFYQVLLEKVLSADYGMFEYDEETRYHWFRRDSLESEQSWVLLGTMFGLAAFNSILLDVQFPPVWYRKMQVALRNNMRIMQSQGGTGIEAEVYEADVDDVKETFPAIGNSLGHLLEYDGDDVEEVFGLTFEISYKGLFDRVQNVELIPDGANVAVRKDNRELFANAYTEYLINSSIKNAFSHFALGFSLMLKGPFVHRFSADELETLLVGEKELDFEALRSVAKYEGYSEKSKVIEHLWQVLMEYDLTMKRLFLSFVTGTDRAPIGGLRKLKLVIQRSEGDSNRLPTSHTCFNVLLLPEYGTRAKLRDRLSTAIRNSKGFGLR